jgi:UDP-N-acetylglucosamine 3-dehydrogenase
MRIAVLGAGEMGKAHLSAYSRDDRVEIVGVASRTRSSARALANLFEIEGSTDPMRYIEDDTIDAIDITTPTALHRSCAEAALKGGKHVFVESPIAMDVSEAESMAEAADRSRRILMVAESGRFVPERVRIEKMAEEEAFGRPLEIRSSLLMRPYWQGRDFARFGEPLLEKMIHDFDFFNWVAGQPVIVQCLGTEGESGSVERAMVHLWTADGVHGAMELNTDMPSSYPYTSSLRVHFEEGMVESEVCLCDPDPLITLTSYPNGGTAKELAVGDVNAFQEECSYFISCVEKRADPAFLGPRNAILALQVAQAAKESFRVGKAVTIRPMQTIIS